MKSTPCTYKRNFRREIGKGDGHQNSYWHCYSGKSLRDDHLKELTAEDLGLESFDETVFLEQIDYISVRDITHLTFHFNDGHTEELDYEFRKEGVKWTDDQRVKPDAGHS